jgi:class 3 adenylate cyclase/ActR/RegA family two-component response regulator
VPTTQAAEAISVFLADDNLIVREGVRALLGRQSSLRVVGEASDYQELLTGAEACRPQVLVTDIRMPPTFQQEGIAAAKELRKLQPGLGVVVLSQYDDHDYAVSLLSEGAAGYAYLLKDRIAEGDQLVHAVHAVAIGGTSLDPAIVDALVHPVTTGTELAPQYEELLRQVAQGRSIKAIAAARRTTPEAISADVEQLFVKLAEGVSRGTASSLRRLRVLCQAIVDREEQGETLSRMLPTGLAEKVRRDGGRIGETERLQVTVLISDVRGYSTIAEHSDPAMLAGQLNTHRGQMNVAIMSQGGTVMQYVGDAVLAVFGAPVAAEQHADRALAAALAMHEAQSKVNQKWKREGLAPFGLGIGVSSGEVAAALLGSDERVEYTVVGDTVNVAQRLEELARPAGCTVLSEATWQQLTARPGGFDRLPPQLVKGRDSPLTCYRLGPKPYASQQSANQR